MNVAINGPYPIWILKLIVHVKVIKNSSIEKDKKKSKNKKEMVVNTGKWSWNKRRKIRNCPLQSCAIYNYLDTETKRLVAHKKLTLLP